MFFMQHFNYQIVLACFKTLNWNTYFYSAEGIKVQVNVNFHFCVSKFHIAHKRTRITLLFYVLFYSLKFVSRICLEYLFDPIFFFLPVELLT